MYIYIYIYVYVYIYVCVCVFTYIYISLSLQMHIYNPVPLFTCSLFFPSGPPHFAQRLLAVAQEQLPRRLVQQALHPRQGHAQGQFIYI